MVKRHIIVTGVILSLFLLIIAAYFYPGGSQSDPHSVGYDWKNNYMSNLFSPTAVNGSVNMSRPWAVSGMFFLALSFGIFFWQFSQKIPSPSASKVIRYAGVISMLFTFLIVTSFHDTMVTLAGTSALVAMFYITVFLFKTRLFFMKIFSVVCLLLFYTCNYIYYTRTYLNILPVLQKILFLSTITWVLCLEYLTTRQDFNTSKTTRLSRL